MTGGALLEVANRVIGGYQIRVFRAHVVKVGLVRAVSAVADGVLDHERHEAMADRVDAGRAHAS